MGTEKLNSWNVGFPGSYGGNIARAYAEGWARGVTTHRTNYQTVGNPTPAGRVRR